jgi:hypothetical protein
MVAGRACESRFRFMPGRARFDRELARKPVHPRVPDHKQEVVGAGESRLASKVGRLLIAESQQRPMNPQ